MVDPIKFKNVLEQVQGLLDQQDQARAVAALAEYHPADSAEILLRLSETERAVIVPLLPLPALALILEQADISGVVIYFTIATWYLGLGG